MVFLLEAQLAEIERKTNEKIWEDTAVEIFYPPSRRIGKNCLPEVKKNLQARCLGLPGRPIFVHVAEPMLPIQARSVWSRFLLSKTSMKVSVCQMICGKRVMDYLNMVNEQNHQISVKLSAKIGETAAAVARLQDENFRLKGQVSQMVDELCRKEAERCADAEVFFSLWTGWMQIRSAGLCRCSDADLSGCCAVFSKSEDGSYKYAMGEKNGDLRQFTKEMNAALNGRRRRKAILVQGSVKASEEEIRSFFQQ